MSEWSMVTVLKTVVRKHRGFESLSLRHFSFGKGVSIGLRSRRTFPPAEELNVFISAWRSTQEAEGAPLLRE